MEGSIRTRKWQDQATGQDRYATEIRVDDLQMLGRKADGAAAGAAEEGSQPPQMDDDVPF